MKRKERSAERKGWSHRVGNFSAIKIMKQVVQGRRNNFTLKVARISKGSRRMSGGMCYIASYVQITLDSVKSRKVIKGCPGAIRVKIY